MVKNSHANAGDTRDAGSNPWVGKIPWIRKRQPTVVFLPENPMDRGWVTESQTRLKQLNMPAHTHDSTRCHWPHFWKLHHFRVTFSISKRSPEFASCCLGSFPKFSILLTTPSMAGVAAASVGMDVLLLCHRGRGFSIFHLKSRTCFTLVAHSTMRSRGKHKIKFFQVFWLKGNYTPRLIAIMEAQDNHKIPCRPALSLTSGGQSRSYSPMEMSQKFLCLRF